MIEGLSLEKVPLYQKNGVTVNSVVYKGVRGLSVYFENPEALHAIGEKEIKALNHAFDKISEEVIEKKEPYKFMIFHRRNDPLHVGANVKQFQGDVDPKWAENHTREGVELDVKIKKLSKHIRTVSTVSGDNYGGSLEVPIMFEYVVGDSRSTGQYTEVLLELIPGWGGFVNTAIKAGIINAEYMTKTGNRVDAEELYKIGIFDLLVDVRIPFPKRPRKPKEKDFIGKPEEFDKAMKEYKQTLNVYNRSMDEHHQETYEELMPVALELAIMDEVPKKSPENRLQLRTIKEMEKEAKYRSNPENYNDIAGKPERDVREQLKEKKGKPLGPGAVKVIDKLVGKSWKLGPGVLLDYAEEMGMYEAELCNRLMQSDNRKEGVNALLERRIAKFKEVLIL